LRGFLFALTFLFRQFV